MNYWLLFFQGSFSQSLEQRFLSVSREQFLKTKCHFYFTDATSKTTIIVKFKGAIDIVITPVVLESAQRMYVLITCFHES